ncbi:SDR family oxidoreductase [Niallia sp. Sow4_A1]|uniref:SDR family oxidoreductase n=1 Tax=Niallia sp. Sow4_A1 TaxID=3438793 RepID=UPI003F959F48
MEQTKAKVIIITGASSGIGEATAKLLAKKGAKIVLAARREDRLQKVCNEIEKEGGDSIFLKVDVSSTQDMQELIKFTLEHYGRIDVLINNAGVMPLSQLQELKVDEWDRMIDINIKGVLYGIAAVLPTMRNQKGGHIINISSVAGYQTSPTSAVYSGTKYAVRAITEGLRQEESPESNIRTTIVSPGIVKTELTNSISSREVKEMVSKTEGFSISPISIARSIAFAIDEPEDTSINEIIIRPTAQLS